MSTLTKTGLTDEPNHLSVAVSGMRERRFQRVHFGGAANETRQAARYGYVQPAAHAADLNLGTSQYSTLNRRPITLRLLPAEGWSVWRGMGWNS